VRGSFGWPLRIAATAAVACAAAACVSVPEPMQTSPRPQPPLAWQSGMRFRLADATTDSALDYRAELRLIVAGKEHVVTTADHRPGETGPITDWYRLGSGVPVVLRLHLHHENGVTSVGELALVTREGWFYEVGGGVSIPYPETAPPLVGGPSDQAVSLIHPGSRLYPRMQVHIGYGVRIRDCFDCPS
jgi:hypothetical protein